MSNFFIILSIWFITSCTHISYQNSGNNRSFFQHEKGYMNSINIKQTKEFYVWGLIPKEHIIDVSELLESRAIVGSISSVKIREYQTFYQALQQLITLGLFIPKTIEVRGYVEAK